MGTNMTNTKKVMTEYPFTSSRMWGSGDFLALETVGIPNNEVIVLEVPTGNCLQCEMHEALDVVRIVHEAKLKADGWIPPEGDH